MLEAPRRPILTASAAFEGFGGLNIAQFRRANWIKVAMFKVSYFEEIVRYKHLNVGRVPQSPILKDPLLKHFMNFSNLGHT
jgi:hypothetical protein